MFPVVYYVFYVVRIETGQYIHSSEYFQTDKDALDFAKKLIGADAVRAVQVMRINFNEEED